jgi:CHAT domain
MSRIKVLFLTANPVGTTQLKLDEEHRQITARIRASEHRDALEVISRWAVRPDDVLQAFLEDKPHVVHFSGHGSKAAELILMDQAGNPKPVSKKALAGLFSTLKGDVRVVLLNACWSRPQAKAIAANIDCTIGMNREIGDDAAIVYAANFYRALGFGKTVKEAFELGNVALLMEGIPEAKTAELFEREGVDAATVRLVDPSTEDIIRPSATRPQDNVAEVLGSIARLTLIKALAQLDPSDFGLLEEAIPGASSHTSPHASVPERAAQLVRWAESPTGPGLDAIYHTASRIFSNFPK